MNAAVRLAVERALATPIARVTPLSGGDINDAYRVELTDGAAVFVKTNDSADPSMFPAEARGLAWLAEPGALRIPRVLAVSPDDRTSPAFLVLEYVASAARTARFDEHLGRGLAALHAAGAPAFGLDRDNFIARLAQQNAPAPTWAEFYSSRRLAPQLALAAESGLATPALRAGFERLFSRLGERVGPEEPPARLHGDLWAGNLRADDHGEPCVFDPAVYGGHREMDLAMMRLFGGFDARVFDAYAEAHPLSAGHEERVALYQLYPLMVHVNLFGGSYVSSVERVLAGIV